MQSAERAAPEHVAFTPRATDKSREKRFSRSATRVQRSGKVTAFDKAAAFGGLAYLGLRRRSARLRRRLRCCSAWQCPARAATLPFLRAICCRQEGWQGSAVGRAPILQVQPQASSVRQAGGLTGQIGRAWQGQAGEEAAPISITWTSAEACIPPQTRSIYPFPNRDLVRDTAKRHSTASRKSRRLIISFA